MQDNCFAGLSEKRINRNQIICTIVLYLVYLHIPMEKYYQHSHFGIKDKITIIFLLSDNWREQKL